MLTHEVCHARLSSMCHLDRRKNLPNVEKVDEHLYFSLTPSYHSPLITNVVTATNMAKVLNTAMILKKFPGLTLGVCCRESRDLTGLARSLCSSIAQPTPKTQILCVLTRLACVNMNTNIHRILRRRGVVRKTSRPKVCGSLGSGQRKRQTDRQTDRQRA